MKKLITSALTVATLATLIAIPVGGLAQTRSSASGQTTRSASSSSSGQTVRSSSSSASGQTVRSASSSSSGQTVRSSSSSSSGQTVRSASSSTSGQTVRSASSSASGQTVRSSTSTSVAGGNQVRSAATTASSISNNVTSRGLSPATQQAQKNAATSAPASSYKVDNHNVVRIPPRERGFTTYTKPGSFWGTNPHYFGWRVEVLPPKYTRVSYFGVDYYLYNNVYYRAYGSHYVVVRPPVGIVIDLAPKKVKLGPVTFSFYHNVYRTYSGWDSYSRYIDEQNRIIAQNNAIIAAQNAMMAMNQTAAQNSYAIANQLGLAQSYAYANQEYYYDDGVFYIINSRGRYEVIVPPAGALVDRLPDDYETIVIGGQEYYLVDDTVYRLTLVGGLPCLEVLGQMYGDLYRRYSYYYR